MMKTLLAFLVALVAPCRAEEPLDVGRMVSVLRALENGPASNPWQFKEATWLAYTRKPMADATEAEHKRAAWLYVQACVRYCLNLNLPINARNVALIFTAGYGTVATNKATAHQWSYASRANNLYHDKTFN